MIAEAQKPYYFREPRGPIKLGTTSRDFLGLPIGEHNNYYSGAC